MARPFHQRIFGIILGDSGKGRVENQIIDVEAKVRYRANPAKAKLYPLDNKKAKVVFEEPQRAVTPGQSLVFYDNDIVLGGGKII